MNKTKITIARWLGPISSLYFKLKLRERKKSWGPENEDKTFYVIGSNNRNGGLWWLVNITLNHLNYADEKGYIPVVDYKNYWTQYTTRESYRKDNVWEYFFAQPGGYSLEQISKSKNIIINKKDASPEDKYLMGHFYDDPPRIERFRYLFRKYIKFNEETRDYLDNLCNSVIGDKRTVGVLCRGTDYVMVKPKNHPIQPDTETVIEDTRKVMKEYCCTHVFIATEDQDILDSFKTEFGECLLYLEQERLSKKGMGKDSWLADEKKKHNIEQNKRKAGLDYMAATYILSRCTCYIGGRTGGSKGVLIMTKGFEFEKTYNLGLY